MKKQLILLFAMGGLFVLSFSASPVMGTAFTLSDAALMSLDWAPLGWPWGSHSSKRCPRAGCRI